MLLLNKYLKTSKLLLVVCLFLLKNTLLSQTNLIQNGSFETFVNLNQPSFYGKFWVYNPSYTQIVDNWLTINSPDHFDSAFIPGGYNVPYSRFGNSFAKTGNAYAGICVFDLRFDYQEYSYQHLTNPLKADSVYCLSFFTARADRTPFAIKSIGALLSVNVPTLTGGYISATPQITNNSNFLTDTVNWQEIKGCYTAQGGEEYITIGNFNTNSNIDTLRILSTNPLMGVGTDISYYYIDSVTLWQNNFPTSISEINNENTFSIYPNPANTICTISSKTIIQKTELTNIAGQVLLSEIVNEKTHQLQLQNFSQGIYFIKVHYPNGLSVTRKVIVNR